MGSNIAPNKSQGTHRMAKSCPAALPHVPSIPSVKINLPKLKPTKWRFTGSGGTRLTSLIFKKLYLGGGIGNFYAMESSKPKVYQLPYKGAGAGLGAGVSAGKKVSVAFSATTIPGSGIFQIYRHPLRPTDLSAGDFQGPF